jgi:hypothetical protein
MFLVKVVWIICLMNERWSIFKIWFIEFTFDPYSKLSLQTRLFFKGKVVECKFSIHKCPVQDRRALFRRVRRIWHVWPSEWNNSSPTGHIFMKFYSWVFFENLLRKYKFQYNRTRIKDTLHLYQYRPKFLGISRSFWEREMFQTNGADKTKNTLFMFRNLFKKIVPFMR